MKVQLNEIVSTNTAKLCVLPYPNHPKGCPNFNKKEGCPPNTPLWDSIIKPPYYLFYQQFDLQKQEQRMLKRHPRWSKRQARCCLYWQRKVVKSLLDDAWGFLLGLEYDTNDRYVLIDNGDILSYCKGRYTFQGNSFVYYGLCR